MRIHRITGGRSFEAALTTRLNEDLPRTPQAPNALVREAFLALLARGRFLHGNHPQSKGWIDFRLPSQVLGPTGIMIHPKVKKTRGTALNKTLNKVIEEGWKNWTKHGSCTMDGRCSFKDVLDHVLKSCARDGEVLIQVVRGPEVQNKWGIALHLLEGEHLDVHYDQRRVDAHGIMMGVEINQWRRPMAYHVLRENPHDAMWMFAQAARARMTPRQLIHVFKPFYPSQMRGVTWLHAAADDGAALKRYMEAELVAARAAASKSIVLQTKDPGEAAQLAGSQRVKDDEGEYREVFEDHIEPGQTWAAPRGWEAHILDPKHPNQNFGGFEEAVLRSMASAVGASYHSFSGNMRSVNYSSARIAELSERDIYRDLQQWMIDHVIQPVFMAWLEMAALRPEFRIPVDQLDAVAEQVDWQPRGFFWVDPQKEVDSAVTELDAGLTSRTRILSKFGVDYATILEERQEEERLLDEAGLRQDPPNGGTQGDSAAEGTGDDRDDGAAPPSDDNDDSDDQDRGRGRGRKAKRAPQRRRKKSEQ